MPVKVKMTTPKAELRAYIAKGVESQKQKVIRMMSYIGEQCVNDARLKGSYTDRTGNLRGSTGYCVVVDGQIVNTAGFAQVRDGKEGPNKGENYVNALASGYTSGIVLIVVAGMHYAAYVADRGYNVLDSAEILAEKLIGELQRTML